MFIMKYQKYPKLTFKEANNPHNFREVQWLLEPLLLLFSEARRVCKVRGRVSMPVVSKAVLFN